MSIQAVTDRPINHDDKPTNPYAAAMGKLPKQLYRGRRRVKRKWTGFIDGQRCWAGRPIVMPRGELGWVESAQRGFVQVRTAKLDPKERFPIHEWIESSKLRLVKNPAAVALGKLKAGVKERKCELKAAASRRNGANHKRHADVDPKQSHQPKTKLTRGQYQPSLDFLIKRMIRRRYGAGATS